MLKKRPISDLKIFRIKNNLSTGKNLRTNRYCMRPNLRTLTFKLVVESKNT